MGLNSSMLHVLPSCNHDCWTVMTMTNISCQNDHPQFWVGVEILVCVSGPIVSMHGYKTIQVNCNPIHLIKQVKFFNPNLLISYLVYVGFTYCVQNCQLQCWGQIVQKQVLYEDLKKKIPMRSQIFFCHFVLSLLLSLLLSFSLEFSLIVSIIVHGRAENRYKFVGKRCNTGLDEQGSQVNLVHMKIRKHNLLNMESGNYPFIMLLFSYLFLLF